MKRVYAYVVADLLHMGHVLYLERARALGDRLIVGVLTMRACMEKKPKPVTRSVDRYNLVRALRCVDTVCWQREYSPLENVRKYRPDVLVESESHKEQPANGWCAQHGIEVVGLPYTGLISSSKIMERIVREHETAKRG